MESLFGFLETVGLDFLVRGRFRPGFFFGSLILASAALFGIVAFVFACISMHIGILCLLASAMFGLIGGLMIVRQDLRDQDAGLISNWGDWWEGWSNNRFSNSLEEGLILISMTVVAALFGLVLCDPQDSFIRTNMPYVVKAFDKSKADSPATGTKEVYQSSVTAHRDPVAAASGHHPAVGANGGVHHAAGAAATHHSAHHVAAHDAVQTSEHHHHQVQ